MAASLLWNLYEAKKTALDIAGTEVRLSHKKDLSYRIWAARHGGVYVPATPETPPNPYLSHLKERDIRTPSGVLLTLVNPAYMTRQVHELSISLYGARGHLTSLRPLRPENIPDQWEEKALKSFAAGVAEAVEAVSLEGEPYMRFMRPIHVESACLKCHAVQGDREGDIRGGISVSVPLQPYFAAVRAQTLPLAAGHGLIWLLGLVGITLRERHVRRYLEERRQAGEALQQAHDELEQRVQERTTELQVTVGQLKQEVTERSRIEQEIVRLNAELDQRVRERTAALEFANREMESFSYSVSHDLKAPIRAIQGFSRMLTAEYAPRLDAEGQRLFGVIINNTQTMSNLIDDLLALSQVGRHQIKMAPVNLEALARQIFNRLRELEPARDLQLTVLDLPLAWADPSLIRQVLVNLLGNAIKFTQSRKTAVIEVGGNARDKETVYYVRDNGVGFDERYAHKLFDAFQRLHSGQEYEGTGIGLAIVHRIIQRHGGRVWAESKVNAGATFYFSLPKNPE